MPSGSLPTIGEGAADVRTTDTAAPDVKFEAVTKRYGAVLAVDAIDLEVSRGAFMSLLGPSGCGKTTTLRLIAGLEMASAGTILIGGHDVTRLSVHRRARMGLSRTFQKLEAFNSLSARDNVLVAAETNTSNGAPAQLTDEILDRVGLGHVADITVGTLPTGTARLVELARALAVRPRVLLLDEASSGLTEDETAAVGELLKQLVAEHDLAVLLVEHDMSFVMNTCSRIHVLDFGQMIAAGTPEEVQENETVRAAYLGSES